MVPLEGARENWLFEHAPLEKPYRTSRNNPISLSSGRFINIVNILGLPRFNAASILGNLTAGIPSVRRVLAAGLSHVGCPGPGWTRIPRPFLAWRDEGPIGSSFFRRRCFANFPLQSAHLEAHVRHEAIHGAKRCLPPLCTPASPTPSTAHGPSDASAALGKLDLAEGLTGESGSLDYSTGVSQTSFWGSNRIRSFWNQAFN